MVEEPQITMEGLNLERRLSARDARAYRIKSLLPVRESSRKMLEAFQYSAEAQVLAALLRLGDL